MFCVLDQPKDLSSLTNSLESLQITKPLAKKKDEYLKAIRSQKRKLHLHNKRITAVDSLTNQLDNINIQEDNFGQGIPIEDYINDCLKESYTLEQIPELVRSLFSPNLHRQHFGAIGIRKLLSAECDPPIQTLIDAGIIPKLIEFLGKENEKQLQLEAAWSLSNLASGTSTQTQEVVDNGALPELIKLLGSPHKEVSAQAVWTLGNIAGDSFIFRDLVLRGEAVSPLVNLVETAISDGDMTMIKQGTWALANLCRGKPAPPFRMLQETILVFAKVIMGLEDLDALMDAFTAISNLSNGGSERIQKVFDTGVVPFLVKYMNHCNLAIQSQCLKTIGNLFTSHDEHTNSLLAIPGVIDNLFLALSQKKKLIRREAAWTLSNIAAGTCENLQHIIGNAVYLDMIFEIGLNDIFEVRKEIAWVLANALTCANRDQLRILFDKKIIEYFGQIIEQEKGLQELGLRGIKDILYLEERRAPEGFSGAFCWSLLEQNNIVTTVEKLKDHANFEIAELALGILAYNETEEGNQEEVQQTGWNF